MSFTIQLFWNKSDNIVVNKNITSVTSVTGALRNESEIVDPTILIEYSHPNNFNYLYIEEFKRYYYVVDRTSIRNNIVEVSAHCDVLMTYKAQFLNLPAVIDRNTHDYNVYLPDDQFSAMAYERVQLRKFPNSLSKNKNLIFVCTS